MDLESILPLLMKGGGGGNSAAMLSALSGDKSKLIENMVGSDPKAKELMGMMNMMNNKKKPSKPHIGGLKAIYSFAPQEILGILVKHFSRQA